MDSGTYRTWPKEESLVNKLLITKATLKQKKDVIMEVVLCSCWTIRQFIYFANVKLIGLSFVIRNGLYLVLVSSVIVKVQ